MRATSSMARSKAFSLAFDGRVKPLSLRTNWNEAARISSSVAGGSKLKSVLMLRHMSRVYRGDPQPSKRCDNPQGSKHGGDETTAVYETRRADRQHRREGDVERQHLHLP